MSVTEGSGLRRSSLFLLCYSMRNWSLQQGSQRPRQSRWERAVLMLQPWKAHSLTCAARTLLAEAHNPAEGSGGAGN